jgi:hypothetical protein
VGLFSSQQDTFKMDFSKKNGGAQIIDGIAIAKEIRTEIAEDVKRMNEVYGKVRKAGQLARL